MSARLRIHRRYASPERVLCLGAVPVGPLAEEVSEFDVPPGRHIVSVCLGSWRGAPLAVDLRDGSVTDLEVTDNPDAILPLFQSGFAHLAHVPWDHGLHPHPGPATGPRPGPEETEPR